MKKHGGDKLIKETTEALKDLLFRTDGDFRTRERGSRKVSPFLFAFCCVFLSSTLYVMIRVGDKSPKEFKVGKGALRRSRGSDMYVKKE